MGRGAAVGNGIWVGVAVMVSNSIWVGRGVAVGNNIWVGRGVAVGNDIWVGGGVGKGVLVLVGVEVRDGKTVHRRRRAGAAVGAVKISINLETRPNLGSEVRVALGRLGGRGGAAAASSGAAASLTGTRPTASDPRAGNAGRLWDWPALLTPEVAGGVGCFKTPATCWARLQAEPVIKEMSKK